MQVFEKIKDRILYHSDETKYRYEIGKAVIDECVKDIIKDLGLENNGWIPCCDRLPEESLNSVIGWDEYRQRCCFVQYFNGVWKLGDYESVKITHWQPTPLNPIQQKGE